MKENKVNIFELIRDWWDFCFENPELIKPNHSALYFFILEHNNRLGWKTKFGLPSTMSMEAIGIKSYNTYIQALNDIIDWGFIEMIEKSRNQYSSNIIAISKYDKANNKAFDRAMGIRSIKKQQSTDESTIQSTRSIIIPKYNIPREGEREKKIPPENPIFEKVKTTFNIPLDECKQQFLSDELHLSRLCKNLDIQLSDLKFWIIQFFIQQENEGVAEKSLLDTKSHFGRWISIKLEKQNGRKEEKSVYD